MSGNCELGRGLRRRWKNATDAGARRFEKPAPDARASPPETHESLIGRKTFVGVPLTGLSLIYPSVVLLLERDPQCSLSRDTTGLVCRLSSHLP